MAQEIWDRSDNINGCWEWQASISKTGYANYWDGQRPARAHRISYEVFRGEITKPCVCHSCDNPRCVNPEHLFLGTHKENTADMMRKGRYVNNFIGNSYQSYGEKNSSAKLSNDDVRNILSSRLTGQELADKYGVTRNHIYRIKRGERRSKG